MILTYLKMNLKAMTEFRLNFVMTNVSMLIGNALLLGAILYMAHISEGFGVLTFAEFIFSFAVGNIAYFFAINFFSGITKMQRTIISGELDKLLIRPISPYKHILMHRINPYGLAEIITAIIFLILVPINQWPLLLFFSITSAIILHFSVLALNTIPFYIDLNSETHLWDLMITFMFYPTYMTNAFGKFISFFLIPGALVTFGPVFALKYTWFAIFYGCFTVAIVILGLTLFHKGLQKYKSAGQ